MTANHHPAARRAASLLAAGTLALALAPGTAGAARVTHRHVVKVVTIAGVGRVLETMSGHALYTYTKDAKDRSHCFGSCLAIWPALTVPARTVPTGTTGLGVFQRVKGVYQVTFRGRPLYTFVSDTAPNAVKGNHVAGFVVATLTGTVGKTKSSGTKKTTTTTSGGYGY